MTEINIIHVMRSQKWEPLAPIFTIFFKVLGKHPLNPIAMF